MWMKRNVKKVCFLLVIFCVLFGVVYQYVCLSNRVQIKNEVTQIDCPIEVSLQNAENKQVLVAQEVISKQNLVKEFEKTISGDAHIEIALNGETIYKAGYIDRSVHSISIHIEIVDYDKETGQVTICCRSKIGLTTTTETISANVR